MTPRREVVAGERRHVEWRVGNVPIVVSVPHGGSIVPRGAPLRSARCAVVEKDHHTMELADQLDQAFHRLTGRHLHMIVCHLDRACVDVNRRKEDAGPCDGCDMGCQLAGHGDAEDQDGGVAAQAWLDYHGFIDRAKEHAAGTDGRVLYMDLHGQSHPEDWMEIGYGLRPAVLANSDEHLDETAPPSSISTFARRAGVSYSDVLRGALSIGALLEHLGYRSVPSPSHPCPAGGHYFNGGYSVRRHCSADDGVMGFQLEVTRAVRRTHEARSAFASKLALALATYCAFHCGYSFALKLLPLPVKEALQCEAHVPDKDASENRHGQRVVHAKANLYH